jgi:sulfite exporter TauE/SafE
LNVSMTLSLTTGLLLGLLLGMRHALEPDHLAAISTLVTRRGNPRAGAVLGVCWGLGHSVALFSVGCVLAALDSHLPASVADGFELLVAVMLFALGARAVLRAARADAGDARRPVVERGRWTLARTPILVGLVHGLAGSGALTALVLARLPTAGTRILYIALFGVGSIIGMAALTGIAGWPLARVDRSRHLSRWLAAATGTFSLLLGAGWGWAALRAWL